MALVAADLAEKIRSDMGFPLPVSTQLIGWATGVIDEIQGFAVVDNASGTITGDAPAAGGALSNGAGTNGLITGMLGSRMATGVRTEVGYPFVSSRLTIFCDEIVSHILGSGKIGFASGQITGTCTNTLLSPGPLTSGAGTLGTMSGLNGTTLANNIHTAVGYPGGVSTRLIQFCTAFTDYIMSNSDTSYVTGNVTATCPLGGGAITGGTGVTGAIA